MSTKKKMEEKKKKTTTQDMCDRWKIIGNGIPSLSRCAITTEEIDHKWNKSEIYWNIKENKWIGTNVSGRRNKIFSKYGLFIARSLPTNQLAIVHVFADTIFSIFVCSRKYLLFFLVVVSFVVFILFPFCHISTSVVVFFVRFPLSLKQLQCLHWMTVHNFFVNVGLYGIKLENLESRYMSIKRQEAAKWLKKYDTRGRRSTEGERWC